MTVISFVSSKGGAGKSTAALTIAGAIANGGSKVVLMDADPNQPLQAWSELGGMPEGIDVMGGITISNFSDGVKSASEQAPFVFIDLEGTQNELVGLAIVRSDYVLIPTQGSYLDAKESIKALGLIESYRAGMKKNIGASVLFTRTSAAIRGGTFKEIIRQFDELNVPYFDSQLMEREAFKLVFSIGGTVFQLEKGDVSGVEKAQENADAVAQELINHFKPGKRRNKAA